MPIPCETFAHRPLIVAVSALIVLGLAFTVIILGFRPTGDAMLTESAFRQSRSSPTIIDNGWTNALSAQFKFGASSLSHGRGY
jgi:hypothetical protein